MTDDAEGILRSTEHSEVSKAAIPVLGAVSQGFLLLPFNSTKLRARPLGARQHPEIVATLGDSSYRGQCPSISVQVPAENERGFRRRPQEGGQMVITVPSATRIPMGIW